MDTETTDGAFPDTDTDIDDTTVASTGTTGDGSGGPRHVAGVATIDADGREIPVDLAAWIDEHDPVVDGPVEPGQDAPDDGREDLRDAADRHAGDAPEVVPAATVADEVLARQRAVHEPDERSANDAVGTLVNNTGDDGGAASG